MPSLADLEYAFYGGGNDAKMTFMQSAYNAGLDAVDMLAPTPYKSLAPVGAKAWSIDRSCGAPSNQTPLVSGTLYLVGLECKAGDVAAAGNFLSGTQAAVAPTNWWMALYSKDLVLRAQTIDKLATAWGANVPKSQAFITPYTFPSTDLYYLGLMVAAGTVPSLLGTGGNANAMGGAGGATLPIICATSSAGLTGAIPDPAGALTAVGPRAFCWIT